MEFFLELTGSKLAAALIASIVSFTNFIYYVFTIFKGKTKPHLYTWLAWGIITLIIAIIQTLEGETYGAWLAYTVAAVSLARAALAIPYGEKNITKSDRFSLLVCFVSTVFWLVFKQPVVSVLLLTTIDLVAYYPTFRKSWYKPYEEPVISHFVFGLTYTLGIIAIDDYSFTTATYHIAVAAFSYMFVVYALMRRKAVG